VERGVGRVRVSFFIRALASGVEAEVLGAGTALQMDGKNVRADLGTVIDVNINPSKPESNEGCAC